MEGLGFDRPEIEKVLSEKHQVSRRSVGYDFERRSVWQPQLTGKYEAHKSYCKIENLYLQAYRDAAFGYMHAQTENGKIGFLHDRLHIIDSLARLYGVGTLGKVELTQAEPFIIKMWRPEIATAKT